MRIAGFKAKDLGEGILRVRYDSVNNNLRIKSGRFKRLKLWSIERQDKPFKRLRKYFEEDWPLIRRSKTIAVYRPSGEEHEFDINNVEVLYKLDCLNCESNCCTDEKTIEEIVKSGAIRVNDEGRCTYFVEALNLCSIQEAKPEACKSYPYKLFFKEAVEVVACTCPGQRLVPSSELSDEEISAEREHAMNLFNRMNEIKKTRLGDVPIKQVIKWFYKQIYP